MKFRRWCRNCNCEQEVAPIMGYEDSWRKLFWLLEFLRTEETIAEATFDEYMEHLMFFGKLAFDADDEIEKRLKEEEVSDND
ncbi:hypothetical protein LCGC14_0140640 [marine sediment metagenome]|uniref:Uncharacterized protein n=1 Tax=marine sediment metagenome TaxID=412755 RepID=A0A0F9Y2E8_9ZZZZ